MAAIPKPDGLLASFLRRIGDSLAAFGDLAVSWESISHRFRCSMPAQRAGMRCAQVIGGRAGLNEAA